MDREEVITILKTVEDPELQIDVWTLELIREIKIDDKVRLIMTFTTPLCPYGDVLMDEIKEKINSKGMDCEIDLSFKPLWKPSEKLLEVLGMGM